MFPDVPAYDNPKRVGDLGNEGMRGTEANLKAESRGAQRRCHLARPNKPLFLLNKLLA